MQHFLKKRWFLLVLAGGFALVWLRPEWLQWTDRLDPRAVVASALFLASWSLESRRLWQTLLHPLPALWALCISYGLLPALAWLIGPFLPNDDYRLGLLIMVSVPCTLASAVLWTRLAGGNEAMALLITLLTTLTSWLATTAWLVAGAKTQVSLDSAGVMAGLFLVLVLPVGVGQLCRAVGPLARTASRFQVFLGVIGRLLILVIILKAALDVSHRLGERADALAAGPLLGTAGACVGLHLLALGGGFWSSKKLGVERPNQIAVAFACSQKTLPVALYLFDAYFKDYPLAVVPMVFYHVGQLVVDTFIAEELAGRQSSDTRLPAESVV